MSAAPTPCRFGYEEHDGARYCFEHGGFLEAGVQSRMCDTARSRTRVIPPGTPEPRLPDPGRGVER